MKRYVIKTKDGFVKWIYGNFTPYIASYSDFEGAQIVDEGYLNMIVAPKSNKSRKELLIEKYPSSEFLEVVITLKGEN